LFDLVWRYRQVRQANEDVEREFELTRNPAIIPRKRGRGSRIREAASSTRRDLSHWEVAEPSQRGRGRGRPCGQPSTRGRGVGIGRGRGRGRGRTVLPITIESDGSSSSSSNSDRENAVTHEEKERFIEQAREKRRREPTWKAAQAALEAKEKEREEEINLLFGIK